MNKKSYFENMRTLLEKEEVEEALDQLIESSYQTVQPPWKDALSRVFSPRIVGVLNQILLAFKITEPSSKDAQILGKVKEELKGFKVLRLTLAFSPSDQFVSKLHKYSQEYVFQSVLLDIVVDPRIVGGLIMEFEGVHKDYTLDTLITEAFERRKEEIQSLLVSIKG